MNQLSFRVGVLGLTHDHVWDHLPRLAADPTLAFAGAADPTGELTDRAAREFHCPTFESCQELLDDDSLEAVWIFADNAGGAELAVEAARRGLHVMIEKPMAATLAGADAMLAEACRSGIRLMVNWPFAWWPQLQRGLELAATGAIGRLWQVRYRAAHAGPRELGCSEHFCRWLFDPQKNGAGGAMLDYCCYGAVLARALLGMPTRVTGVAGRWTKRDIAVEDNALIAMTYHEALAVAEGSWSQIGTLSSYQTILYGAEGTLLVEPRAGGRLLLADRRNPEGREVDVPPPPPHFRDATAHFAWALAQPDEPLHALCDPRHARDAQEILEAGVRSAASGAEVTLPLRAV